jgi:nucleotide-binding universal stress UspA family protein
MNWKKVVCPIDFSEVSMGALRLARQICEGVDGELVIVYVVEPIVAPTDFTYGSLTSGELEDRLVERSRQALAEQIASLGYAEAKVHSRVERGRASAEIVRVAQEEAADLIVIGTHGYTGMAHVLLGSTAERVIRKAPCPVLTVRPKDQAQH